MNMNARNLLIAVSVTVLATTNVLAADALLSPRAADHQIKIISSTNSDPNFTAAHTISTAPRVLDNQIKTVAGKTTEVTPSCARMSGTPKEIGACADHPGADMPCCSVAGSK